MALAAAAHPAPRGQKLARAGVRPGVPEDLGHGGRRSTSSTPPYRDRSVRLPGSRRWPCLVLAGAAGEAVDRTALSYLLQQSLAAKEEEEKKARVEERVKRQQAQVLEEALRVQELTRELFKRKRKKKRKKKLPRTSSNSSCGRARRRQRQWHAPNAGFLGGVTLRAVFPSVVDRPEMLGIMAGVDQKYFPRVWCAHRRLWQWHVQGWSFWCCSSRCVPFYCRQARVARLHARLWNDRFPGPDSAVFG